MPVEVILPKVDMDMTHGILAVWHVAEGETVAKGAALFDIETEKAAMEVEAPATGRVVGITAMPGDRIAVGSVIANIYAEGEAVPQSARGIDTKGDADPFGDVTQRARVPDPTRFGTDDEEEGTDGNAPTQTARVRQMEDAPPTAPSLPASGDAVRATPAARAAARVGGLTLADIPGSGPRGRIQRDDVTAHKAAATDPAKAFPLWSPQPGPLHVSRRAGAGATIVLLHGFTADSQGWAPLEKALGRDPALIRIDLPGHGRSPRRRVQNFADLARMMAEAFDEATRAQGPVHVLGHSLGAALALSLADIRARRIESLTLIAPAGLGPDIDAATLTGITRASRVESLAPWLRRLTATPEAIGDDYARAAMRSRADPAMRAVQADMAQVLFPDGVQAFDLRAPLGRLTVPTAILWGRQDHVLPLSQVAGARTDAALHLIDGAGHIPHIECPERVARIVGRHIRAWT